MPRISWAKGLMARLFQACHCVLQGRSDRPGVSQPMHAHAAIPSWPNRPARGAGGRNLLRRRTSATADDRVACRPGDRPSSRSATRWIWRRICFFARPPLLWIASAGRFGDWGTARFAHRHGPERSPREFAAVGESAGGVRNPHVPADPGVDADDRFPGVHIPRRMHQLAVWTPGVHYRRRRRGRRPGQSDDRRRNDSAEDGCARECLHCVFPSSSDKTTLRDGINEILEFAYRRFVRCSTTVGRQPFENDRRSNTLAYRTAQPGPPTSRGQTRHFARAVRMTGRTGHRHCRSAEGNPFETPQSRGVAQIACAPSEVGIAEAVDARQDDRVSVSRRWQSVNDVLALRCSMSYPSSPINRTDKP